ncbi:MAG: LysE family translocator [Rhodobacteraceae bacterium]|nr:LysE family translocator [Paracoccaceae bacterium]
MSDGIPASLAAFLLVSVLIELTPGPNMVWLAIVAATEGRKSGFAAVAGVASGLAIVGLAAALGLAALIAASPVLYDSLRWAGALYLLWMAWDGWRGADEDPAIAMRGYGLARSFRRGLITNLLNPKAAIFFVAVLPGFTRPEGAILGETILLSVVYVAVATAIHAAIVVMAGLASRLLDDPVQSRLVRRGLSLCLALVALWFLIATGAG